MCVSPVFSGRIKCFISCEGGETVARAVTARRQAAGHTLTGPNEDTLSCHEEPDCLVTSKYRPVPFISQCFKQEFHANLYLISGVCSY